MWLASRDAQQACCRPQCPPVHRARDGAVRRGRAVRQALARRRLAVPLDGVLDEAANICRWRQLPDLHSHHGSRGIPLLTLLQPLSQGAQVWGHRQLSRSPSAPPAWIRASLPGTPSAPATLPKPARRPPPRPNRRHHPLPEPKCPCRLHPPAAAKTTSPMSSKGVQIARDSATIQRTGLLRRGHLCERCGAVRGSRRFAGGSPGGHAWSPRERRRLAARRHDAAPAGMP